MPKFSENSAQNMPELPVAGVLGGADTCNGRKLESADSFRMENQYILNNKCTINLQ
jgi:hypothetical protein